MICDTDMSYIPAAMYRQAQHRAASEVECLALRAASLFPAWSRPSSADENVRFGLLLEPAPPASWYQTDARARAYSGYSGFAGRSTGSSS